MSALFWFSNTATRFSRHLMYSFFLRRHSRAASRFFCSRISRFRVWSWGAIREYIEKGLKVSAFAFSERFDLFIRIDYLLPGTKNWPSWFCVAYWMEPPPPLCIDCMSPPCMLASCKADVGRTIKKIEKRRKKMSTQLKRKSEAISFNWILLTSL